MAGWLHPVAQRLEPVWKFLQPALRRLAPVWRFVRPYWKARVSYMLLLPFLLPFLVFVVYPIVWSARLSTTEYRGIAANPPVPAQWKDEEDRLGNFKQLLSFEIKHLPAVIDPETGEQMYDCGRDNVPESQVAALEAQGETCEADFERPRAILSEGYREFERFGFGGKTYIIGATDPRFLRALYNTIRFAFAAVTLSTLLGLGLALALQRQSRFNFFLRTLFFLPSVTSTLAIATVWRWMLTNEDYGLVNALLRELGQKENITFLANQSYTLPLMIAIAVWGGMGYNMILFLAGLQGIPIELYEAAAVDGANVRQRFWHITLPLLRPTILYVVIIGSITAFQVFELVYVLFASVETIGGVLDSGLTLVPYLYDEGFTQFQLGYAAAIAWVLFLIIFVLTMINLSIGRRQDVI